MNDLNINQKLRKLQLTQLEILKMIDGFCRENNIKYSLYAGTLLGAVRHKGFIPWDDDLDICMSRKEYDRFIRKWLHCGPKGYLLQNKETDPQFTQSFTKIRKDYTTFLQNVDGNRKYHTGIFVDVFPIDRMPNDGFKKKIFDLRCMLYQLYTREFVPPKSNGYVKFLSGLFLKIIPPEKRKTCRKRLLHQITKNNDDHSLNTAAIETLASLKIRFPKDMLDEYTYLQFEDAEYMCFKKWDEHLKCKFGDYMKLPPKEERIWKHHPIMLDFDRNYEEL